MTTTRAPAKMLVWLTAVASMVMGSALTAPSASAHPSYTAHEASVTCLPGQTTIGYSGLDHSYERMSVYAGDPATGTCDFARQYNAPPGWLAVDGQFYHDGVGPCTGTGLIQNSGWATQLTWDSNVDVFWSGCNRGVGVNTYITMDSTWYSYDTWGGRAQWDSGSRRPAEGHCHCP